MTNKMYLSPSHIAATCDCAGADSHDLSSSPQICLEGVRSIFVTFRTPFNYSNVWFLFFNVQISRYSHCFAHEAQL